MVGTLFIIIGTIYLLLYIPTIYAMFKVNLIKNPCYKIMLMLITADICNIIANSIIGGYMFSVGAVFCMEPVMMYIEGAYNITVWGIASFLYVLLAVNRLVVLISNPFFNQAFNKVPTLGWAFLACMYGAWVGIIHKPLPYNSKAFGAIYVPAIEDIATEFPIYENKAHEYNNIVVAILLLVLYMAIGLLLWRKRQNYKGDEGKVSKAEMNALIQAVFITMPALAACLLYVYMQFASSLSLAMAIVGQISWQTLSGVSGIFYLTLNQSIRSYYFHRRVHSTYEESSTRKDSSARRGVINA
ncbi:unnamed protein product, partial [Mesorhabditis belari]|uniref:Uncharacterized protein n=1 Tax=Mesorhabditis belari TaxID=2138241 RepID=A0AAF3FKL2_9BILA